MGGALVEGEGAAAGVHLDTGEPDVGAIGVEADTAAAGGGEDASPVGVGASKSGLHQGRIGDGARDLHCRAVGGGAADFDLDHALRSFAIGHNLKRQLPADGLERSEKSAGCGA